MKERIKEEKTRQSKYWFTSDEHYNHHNILKYDSRNFSSIEEHDKELINRHNELVRKEDIVIHAGDFTLIHNKERIQKEYISKLKGNHIFLKGSHDYWLPKTHRSIWEKDFKDFFIVVCHYAMRHWARSHFNSWSLYGHSHFGLQEDIGKQMCITVTTNNYYPYSLEQIVTVMKNKPDNPYLVKRGDY